MAPELCMPSHLGPIIEVTAGHAAASSACILAQSAATSCWLAALVRLCLLKGSSLMASCFAGLSVAMGNASEQVKSVCQETTLSNDEDGVAAALRKFVLEPRGL